MTFQSSQVLPQHPFTTSPHWIPIAACLRFKAPFAYKAKKGLSHHALHLILGSSSSAWLLLQSQRMFLHLDGGMNSLWPSEPASVWIYCSKTHKHFCKCWIRTSAKCQKCWVVAQLLEISNACSSLCTFSGIFKVRDYHLSGIFITVLLLLTRMLVSYWHHQLTIK